MSYQFGRMGITEEMALIFAIIFPRVFLVTPAHLIDKAAGLAWFVLVLAGLLTWIMIAMLLFVFRRYPGGDLYQVSEQLLGRGGAWLISGGYSIILFLNAADLLRQFAENTLLTALPEFPFPSAILWYAVVAAVLVYFGIEVLARTMFIFLPWGILSLMVVFCLLYPFYNLYHLMPWAGTGAAEVLQTGFLSAGYDVGAIAVVGLAPSFQNLRTLKNGAFWGIGIGVLLKALSTLVFTLVFGVMVGREKTLPFFEMARLVYINRYIQRVEALFILLWVAIGLMAIATATFLGLYLLSRIFRLPTLRPLIPITMVILAELAMLPADVGTVIRLGEALNYWFSLGVYGPPILLFVAALVRKKGKSCCTG